MGESTETTGFHAAADGVRCACPACSGQFVANETPGSTVTGKTVLTIDEAASRLLRAGVSWNGGDASFTTQLTFSFMAYAPSTMPTDTSGFARFNSQQIQAAELALQSWADVANIRFLRYGAGTEGEGAYADDGTLRFANYTAGQDGAAAFAYMPSSWANRAGSSFQGDSWYNTSIGYNANPVMGEYGQQVLVHEIGHALGLKHPSDYNAGGADAPPITYADHAGYYQDSRQYTVMSYFGSTNTGARLGAFASAPQLHDIAAIQRLYGPNMSAFLGDTVYGFNSNAGRPWFTASSGSTALVFSVWDAGGRDTFDFSGFSQAQIIDLGAGRFSDVGGYVSNVSIAAGAVIENAIGGLGADRIIGNEAGNSLIGGLGADTVSGGGGGDSLQGGRGADVLYGDDGADSIWGGQDNDRIEGGAGNEYALGDMGDDVVLGQAGNDILSGGDGHDRLEGSEGDDQGYGGPGDDTLDGGAGSDISSGDDGADRITNSGNGRDMLFGGAGNDTITAGSDGDLLYGNQGIDILTGGSGADTIFGGQDNDQIVGGAGNDEINGDRHDDNVSAGDGDDLIWGSPGSDTLSGGAGRDTFAFLLSSDSAAGARDRIIDFTAGEDLIDLSRIDARSGTPEDDAFVFVGQFGAQSGEAVLSFDSTSNTTTLLADVNGDGVADFELLINGALNAGSGWVL